MDQDGAMSEVQRVGQEQLEAVATTVAASFADDPIWQWIYNTGDQTIPIETGIVLARMLVAQSTPVDAIHVATGCGAVALWSAPAGSSSPDNEQLRDEQTGPHFAAFAGQIGDRISLTGKLSETMKRHRPDEPHWYLGILGTHPDHQNQGLGSAVLSTMIAHADKLGIPTFLESSNPRNYGFYQRHGYVETGEITVEDSPPLRHFWRTPR